MPPSRRIRLAPAAAASPELPTFGVLRRIASLTVISQPLGSWTWGRVRSVRVGALDLVYAVGPGTITILALDPELFPRELALTTMVNAR